MAKNHQNNHSINDTASSSSSSSANVNVNATGRSLIGNNHNRINANTTRVLYIVTSSSEYNIDNDHDHDHDHDNDHDEVQDRFLDQLLPVVIDGVESMVGATATATATSSTFNNFNFDLDVDVFLICAYPLKPEREEMIRNRLPHGVGFQFWEEAAPLAYAYNNNNNNNNNNKGGKNTRIGSDGSTTTTTMLEEHKQALERQHRFVIRDKFDYYDVFLAFEDDMLVRGQHVSHYLRLSTEIERLLSLAPLPKHDGTHALHDAHARDDSVENYADEKFFGDITKGQLERLIPGFIRVEVEVEMEVDADVVAGVDAHRNDHDRRQEAKSDALAIPADHDFVFSDDHRGTPRSHHHREVNVDPSICCLVPPKPNQGRGFPENLVVAPAPDDLIVWDTDIKAFSLRQFPPESDLLDWVVLMLGPGKGLKQNKRIGGFWSGRKDPSKGEKKPNTSHGGGVLPVPNRLAQQGGWMATKTQLIRMNNQLCKSNVLPPFNTRMGNNNKKDQHYYRDFGPQGVEFWSGSHQIFSGGDNHCNMQRILSMDPDHFSNHLLYHTSNNKQHQLKGERIARANDLFGQFNFVRKTAEREKIMLQTG